MWRLLYRILLHCNHRHLRKIDCSAAVVGRLPVGAESGGKSIPWPRMWSQKCFIAAAAAGDITTTVNKGRQAGPMSSLLDVYGAKAKVGMMIVPERWNI